MDTPVKLLVVEDDMIIAAKISMQLTGLGYEVTGIVPRGEEALRHLADNPPDIVLLDIHLRGNLDGIQTAHAMRQLRDLPVIYITANTDEATFNRAKATRPYAFIAKPIKNLDLQRAIELTVSRMAEASFPPPEAVPPGAVPPEACTPLVLTDRIFVRHKDKMVKVGIEDILYVEADRNYCHIYTKLREYVLATTLKVMEEKLPVRYFQRVHRSFVINVMHVDEVAETHVGLAGRQVPLSHALRDDLLKRLQLI